MRNHEHLQHAPGDPDHPLPGSHINCAGPDRLADIQKGAITLNEYILKAEATSIPVLPKGQRVEFRNIDEAFEAGWKTCQEYIASCIEPANVEERKTAQWIPSDIPDSILDKCSECGFDLGANTYHYCPMCGAKMEKLIKVEELEQGADPGYPPFGNSGDDSVDLLDEWLKRHSSTTPVTTIHEPLNQQDCGQRLPCGICRDTMMHCPLSIMQPTWTWSSSTATKQTGGEEK